MRVQGCRLLLAAALIAWMPGAVAFAASPAQGQADEQPAAPVKKAQEGAPCPLPTVNRPPGSPLDQMWRLQSVEVNVVMDVDTCGRTTGAVIESNDGAEEFAAIALRAAARWWVDQSAGRVSRVRLPVHFHPLPDDLRKVSSSRARDVFFDERSSGRGQMPALDADGRLPGFIADPYPIGFFAVEQALDDLHKHARRQSGVARSYYWLWDDEGLSLFELDRLALVRNRQVSDGTHAWVVTSVLCSTDKEGCAATMARLAARSRQHPHAPLLP